MINENKYYAIPVSIFEEYIVVDKNNIKNIFESFLVDDIDYDLKKKIINLIMRDKLLSNKIDINNIPSVFFLSKNNFNLIIKKLDLEPEDYIGSEKIYENIVKNENAKILKSLFKFLIKPEKISSKTTIDNKHFLSLEEIEEQINNGNYFIDRLENYDKMIYVKNNIDNIIKFTYKNNNKKIETYSYIDKYDEIYEINNLNEKIKLYDGTYKTIYKKNEIENLLKDYKIINNLKEFKNKLKLKNKRNFKMNI